MKKTVMLLLCLFALTSYALAQVEPSPWYPNPERPIRQALTLDGLSFYCVGGSTTSIAAFGVYGTTGVTLSTVGGLYPGTTIFTFANNDADTLRTLITTIRKLGVTVPGAEGGWRLKLSTGSYGGNPSYNLTNTTYSCLGAANEKTAAVRTTTGISYLFDKSKLDYNQIWHITKCLVNMTYTSGTPYMYVYDGISSTNTVIDQEKVTASGKDCRSDISDIGTFVSKKNTDLLFDVYNSTTISAGYMNFEYYKYQE